MLHPIIDVGVVGMKLCHANNFWIMHGPMVVIGDSSPRGVGKASH